jgi:hypothetical protein
VSWAGIICSDHGVDATPLEEAPSDPPALCALCPACLTLAGNQIAVLPSCTFEILGAVAEQIRFFRSDAYLGTLYSAPPRSRGPPAIG